MSLLQPPLASSSHYEPPAATLSLKEPFMSLLQPSPPRPLEWGMAGGGKDIPGLFHSSPPRPLHCTENPINVNEMKLRCLVPDSYIHVSVSDLYTLIPGSVCLFGCKKIGRRSRMGDRYMNVEIERQNFIILFWK